MDFPYAPLEAAWDSNVEPIEKLLLLVDAGAEESDLSPLLERAMTRRDHPDAELNWYKALAFLAAKKAKKQGNQGRSIRAEPKAKL